MKPTYEKSIACLLELRLHLNRLSRSRALRLCTRLGYVTCVVDESDGETLKVSAAWVDASYRFELTSAGLSSYGDARRLINSELRRLRALQA